MKNRILPYVIAFTAVLLLGAGCAQAPATGLQTAGTPTEKPVAEQATSAPQIVGGDRDEHGCIGSAGYSWCASSAKCLRPWEEQCPTSTAAASGTTILVSTAKATEYCDGEKMDSAGYLKTITQESKVASPDAGLSTSELAKAIAVLATTGQCQTALKQADVTVAGGTATIGPIEGWAGSSIAMCSCKPQVEVNLLRLPAVAF
jgi:hypothetical protein